MRIILAPILFFALFSASNADRIARQTQLADISQASTSAFVKKNTTVVGTSSALTGGSATLSFNAYQASIGQDFSSAHDWSAYNIVSFYMANKTNQVINFKFITQFQSDPNSYTNAFTGSYWVNPNSGRYFVFYLNVDNPLPYGLKYLNPPLTADALEVVAGTQYRDLKSVWHWRISYQGSTPVTVDLSNIRLMRQSLDFTGLVDAYGQYTDRTWPTKITSSTMFASQLSSEQSDIKLHPGTGETLGTTKLVNPSITLGKWKVVRYGNGNAFLQHPNGRLFWSLGLNSVVDSLPTKVQDRTGYFQTLPSTTGRFANCYSTLNTPAGAKQCYSFRQQNLMMKYGDTYLSPWLNMVKSRFASWGVNTIGIDSNTSLMNSTVPFIHEISTTTFGSRIKPPQMKWGSLPDPYNSYFLSYCQNRFKTGLASYVANQNFMGTFIDNEMSWGTMDTNAHRYNVALGVLKSSSIQPAKIALVNQLTAKYVTISALNASWGTSFASFDAILNNTTWLPTSFPSGMASDFQTFINAFAAKYFSQVRSSLTYAGLKSLYLGCRFADYTNEVVNQAAKSVDVLSFNVYRFNTDIPWYYYSTLPKPVLLSEFGFTMRAMGTFGGPVALPSASGRAFRMQEVLNYAITQPNVIGAHYYAYADQPITGRWSDYENGGFGVMDTADVPYADSVNALRNFTSSMYAVRGASTGTTTP